MFWIIFGVGPGVGASACKGDFLTIDHTLETLGRGVSDAGSNIKAFEHLPPGPSGAEPRNGRPADIVAER